MNSTEDTVRSYSKLAGAYDEVRFSNASGKFLFETDQRIIRQLVAETGTKRLLDVPVGTGRVLSYLADVDVDIVGFDLTEEMLAEAAKVANEERHQLIQGNAAELPFEDHEFDCLTSLRFFHLFEREQRPPFAEEFLRVIQPGGYLIVSFTNGWYAGGINWFKKMIGLKTVEFEHAGELHQLFPGCVVKKCVGNFLPKQWLLSQLPLVGSILRKLTTIYPVNRICWERIYLLQKLDRNG